MGKRKQNKKRSLEATDWKQKSIKRGKEAKALNKRIRELVVSRDSWKNKYIESKKQCITWENELNKIKKKLNEILNL
jgi:oligoribonuclease NrnB/cAMP/cGMP phosphodiesterase (DHH superfamily)